MRKEKKYELNRPFLEIAEKDGEPVLRVRQATRLGYAECPLNGAFDISYPSSPYRRARTIEGGKIVGTIASSSNGIVIFQRIKQ